jgi:putative ABC transport system permease protein
MSLVLIIGTALRALTRNKMRSGLTSLGIIVGVAAVICVVAIGAGASSAIQQAITNIGANMVWIEAGNRNVGGVRTGSYGSRSLLIDDVTAIQQQVSLVKDVSPNVDTHVQLIYGDQNWGTQLRGVAPEFLAVKDWPVVRGDMFTQHDIDMAANVCVLGSSTVQQLFGNVDPLGQTIRVKNEPVKVVGVLSTKGQTVTGQDQDDTLMMPYTTVMKKIVGQWWLDDIMMSAISAQAQPQAETQIEDVLRARHHLRPDQPDDFNIRHPTEIAGVVQESAHTMEVLLASVASVSLLVGGVGIMNIMLVSVTERTREIGLRLAVGARSRDVLRQFLLEALLLSVFGGALGVAIGAVAAQIIATKFGWPTLIAPNAVGLAFGFSAAIGVCFGYYPAFRAARLDPIDALRVE